MPKTDLFPGHGNPFITSMGINAYNLLNSLQNNESDFRTWSVLIRNGNLKIGCQEHTFHKWWWFTEKEIESMHPEALHWWKKNKLNLFNLLTTMGLWSEPGSYTWYQNKEDWYDEWL